MRLIIAALLMSVVLARPAFAGGRWQGPPVPASAPDELRVAVTEADRLYDAREKSDHAKQALEILRQLQKKHGALPHVAWRYARVAWWIAEGSADKEAKRALALEGRAAGEAALASSAKHPETLYFTALCIGEYSHSVGILTALGEGLEAKFRDPLVEVSKAAPEIDNGGVWNALGRYKFELPWPKRDYGKSVEWLRQALMAAPDNLRGRVYLAETLAKRDDKGDADEARKLLKNVLEARAGAYDLAEELRAKEMAKDVLKRLGWSAP